MKKKNLFLKSTSSLLAMLFVVMSAFMFTACDDDPEPEPEPENSILEIVSASETHTQLEAFVTADADLAAALGGNNLTLFAPNDAAFDRLRTILDVESLDQVNPAVIGAVLRYHAVASVELRESFTEESELTSLQGEDITFNADANIFNGGTDTDVEFVGDEILATNGVVHVVETILIPPSIFATIGANLGKVSQTVLLGADFSTLAAAIAKADTYADATTGVPFLTDVLAGDNPITVFAPINQVFASAGITLETFTAEQWYGIIATHVLAGGDFSAEDIQAGLAANPSVRTYATAAQTNIQVGPGIFTNPETGEDVATISAGGAPVVSADITSDNGRVHAVAGIVSSVNTYETVLLGSPGNAAEPSFYNAFSNIRYSYGDAGSASGGTSSPVDLAYYFGNTNQATLASIDSDGLRNNFFASNNSLDIAIDFDTRNSTRFRVTDLSPEQFGGIILNSQLEDAASSENNTNLSATNLQEGSVVAFTLDSDRGGYAGLIRVVSVDDTNNTGTITIEVKVQVTGN
ncbi:Uncaracterized surface protein containing fasciclin (FAS1) repeats [Marivirga sericea]|uniref:Uncaracterized surface protein containing fasciclin (FAS1) repeats n=1 Tax=Marivirga sericea TaxID=1028 RepID=A0A1X7KX31_9BACT|nr:fasciclin domain-containing protein [Marivirga sericea]SMG45990.1 Uncaracterized surface protein containing fasciclin (FAS1) repeats [Marivirga sericea]